MERLEVAIAKARAARQETDGAPARTMRTPRGAVRAPVPDAWDSLETVEPDDAVLAGQRIVAWKKSDSAHAAFDALRTRLLRLLVEKGWRRVLVTSPGKGCGKTTVATNLAVSLARHGATRTLLVDLDFRTPRVARRLGLDAVPLSLAGWLASDEGPQSHFIRIGEGLGVCLNSEPVRNPAELLQDARTASRLDGAVAALDPAAVICDLPPMLIADDALGFLPQVDCVLLVAAAGQTTSEEIRECERLLEGNTNFLGVVLNKCELPPGNAYRGCEYDAVPGDD